MTRLIRELHHVARGTESHHEALRRRLATAFVATFAFDAVGTVVMHALEISSWFTSFFWVTTQLLTVSSQMPNPTTTGGRVMDIFLELWALVIVTALAGSFAAFLQKK